MNWLSKHRYKLLGTGVVIAILAAFFGSTLVRQVWFLAITPSGNFEDYTQPESPDYFDMKRWAAHPLKNDNADLSPKRAMFDNQDRANADVFFIHPTTFLSRSGWNQPLDDVDANTLITDRVLPSQAGVFNTCCRVYAPHYRQATIASFFPGHEKNGDRALELAYRDVKKAFEHFVARFNNTRPFILAGHSQGARHAQRLLEEMIIGTELEGRLVAAYTIGQPLRPAGGVAICNREDQTGCQVSWNSQTDEAQLSIGREDSICVNPLTWTADGTLAGHEKNLGGVDFGASGELELAVADAQCAKGRLLLTEVKSNNFAMMPFGPGNYHLYEFALYHMNIRENAVKRVEAFLAK